MTHRHIIATFVSRLLFLLLIAVSASAQQISDNAVLLSRLAPQGMTGYAGVWGYASEGREYALIGHYNGVSVIDVTAPAAPVEVSFISGPASLWREIKTHEHYAYVTNETSNGLQIIDLKNLPTSATDEVHDQPVNFWDVSDHRQPELVATYHAGPRSIAHNTHVLGDFAFISYYYDGLKVIDISQRTLPIEVANYDTYPDDNFQRGGGYEGAWGAYPFLPSGNVLVSDRTYGLFVVQFNDTRAGYVKGRVFDRDW